MMKSFEKEAKWKTQSFKHKASNFNQLNKKLCIINKYVFMLFIYVLIHVSKLIKSKL